MWWNLWKNGQHAFRKVNNKWKLGILPSWDLKDTSLWAPLGEMKTWWYLMLILENMKYVQFYFCNKFSAVEEGSGYSSFVFRRDWANLAAVWAQLCFSLLFAQLSLSSEGTRGLIPHHFWCLSCWWTGTCFKNIIFVISVTGHGFGSCSSRPICTLHLPEKAIFRAHIQDRIKCAPFRNEGNTVISSNVELICCVYQQDRSLIELQIIGLVFLYLLNRIVLCSVLCFLF